MNNPTCPACSHTFSWREALVRILGPRRPGAALWGIRCPGCETELRVPMSRVLLIAASGVFFGSQTSLVLLGRGLGTTEFWLAKLWLIVGFYLLAIFFFLRLEPVE